MRKIKFLIKPSKCLSTHGGSGYCLGDYWENGAIVCHGCGTRMTNPRPTGGFYGQPTYPSFIRGIPWKMTREGKREEYENRGICG